MDKPVEISGIRIITVSGRIASGSTTLAKHLAKRLGWKHMEGGEIFWEAVRSKLGLNTKDTNLRPDEEDLLFEEKQKEILASHKYIVLESKLAGFCAQGIDDVFKIGVLCEDEEGIDKADIRIDRLVNREELSVDDAKTEVIEREDNDLTKWRKLYAGNDADWVYWDRKYYDLVVNTFTHNQEESLELVLEKLKIK
ncbi:MAG TPA: cytidylate kinase family protein [Candidatus Saccharimonadales bacterium]|nr:cytidylate kinase family protein [Candidatus Saccharimonadales bacterium]